MNIRLNYTGTVDVYDINTTYAASAKAPGLQQLCGLAITQNGEIDEASIREAYSQLSAGAARNLFENGILSGVWTREGQQMKAMRPGVSNGQRVGCSGGCLITVDWTRCSMPTDQRIVTGVQPLKWIMPRRYSLDF